MDLKRVVTILSLLIVLAGCAVPAKPTAFPALSEPVASPTSLKFPYVDLTATVQLAPTKLPTREIPYPGPSPTSRPLGYPGEPGAVFPSRTPEPTVTPDPNLLLTPTVTPVPVFRPELNVSYSGELRPLRIYYWTDAQIWRMDAYGTEELVLDIASTFGDVLPIRFQPHQGPRGPVVSIAPDEQTIAITLPGADGYELHLYDVATGLASRLGPGERPVWAPDSQRLVYERGGDLWYSDLVAGTQVLILPFDQDEDYDLFTLIWLYDSQRLAYTRSYRLHPLPEIWLVDVLRAAEVSILVDQFPAVQLRQAATATDLLYFEAQEIDGENVSNTALWSVRADTGELHRHVEGVEEWETVVTPDGRWLLATGWQSGTEPPEDFRVDLWLVDMDKSELYRLTDGGKRLAYGWRPLGWYPAGGYFILATPERTLWGLNTAYELFPLAEVLGLSNYANYSIPAVFGGQ